LTLILSIRTTNPDQFAEILDAVDADAPSLAASILARFRSASADYAQLTDQELLPGIEENIHRAIAAVVGGRGPSAEERQATEELAETRARQGVGVDALLVAYRLGAEIAWERFIEHARDRGLSADEMLTGSERLRQWADELMIVIIRAHRRVDIEMTQRDHERRAGFVRALVAGTLETAQLRSEALLHELDLGREYVVVRARGGDEGWRIERALRDGNPGVLLALVEGDTVGVLPQAPERAAGATVGVGPSVRLEMAPHSFRVATRNLEAAIALGERGVFRLDELGLAAVVIEEDDIGSYLVGRYVEPLRNAGRFGQDLLHTIETWLSCGTSPERTAAALYIHRNTLRYRLKRYEELTGCDLSEVRCVVEIWWAMQRAGLDERD
jgi:hypothetical protein